MAPRNSSGSSITVGRMRVRPWQRLLIRHGLGLLTRPKLRGEPQSHLYSPSHELDPAAPASQAPTAARDAPAMAARARASLGSECCASHNRSVWVRGGIYSAGGIIIADYYYYYYYYYY